MYAHAKFTIIKNNNKKRYWKAMHTKQTPKKKGLLQTTRVSYKKDDVRYQSRRKEEN